MENKILIASLEDLKKIEETNLTLVTEFLKDVTMLKTYAINENIVNIDNATGAITSCKCLFFIMIKSVENQDKQMIDERLEFSTTNFDTYNIGWGTLIEDLKKGIENYQEIINHNTLV